MKPLDPIFLPTSQDDNETFTRRDFTRLVFKHLKVILTAFVVVTAVVSAILLHLPATYSLTGKVLVRVEDEGKPNFFSGVAAYLTRQDTDPVNRKIETEMELIDARPVVAQVVRELGLQYSQVYHKPYVDLIDLFKRVLGPPLTRIGLIKPLRAYDIDDTVDAFLDSVTVEPIKSKSADTNSNIIKVTLLSPNAELGKKELDSLLAHYVRFEPSLQQQAGRNAQALVSESMDDSYRKVKASQRRLEMFLAAHGPVSLGLGGEHADLTASVRMTGTPIRLGESAAPSLTVSPSGVEALLTSPGDSTTVSMIKAKLVTMQLRLMELGQDFNDNSPKILNVKHMIKELKVELKRELGAYAADQTTQIALERDLHTNEQTYLELKKRLSQIQLFLEVNAGQSADRVVVGPPVIPDTSDWKRKTVVGVLGAFGGMFLGLLLAGIGEYFDHRLDSKDRVQRFLHLPVLATVPLVDEKAIVGAVSLGTARSQ